MELNVQSRKITGKQVKTLRRQGITPLHLYGHGIASLELQASTGEVQKAISRVGTTSLLGMIIDDATKPINVVIREIQRNPMGGQLQHVDFYQVRMEEKIKMEVSIHLTGEAPALKNSDNQLIQELETLDIECLPANIPAHMTVDIGPLTETGKELFVKDVKPVADVVILNNPEQLVVKIAERAAARVEEKKEPVAAAPEAAAPAAAEEPKKE